MSALAISPEITDSLPSQRNLRIALVVSLALHAIVLSIHFKLPEALGKATERALDVILVNAKGGHRPEHAQAKAQVNLEGGGNTDEDRRVKTPLPVSERVQEGSDLVEAQQRVAQLEAQQRQIMTSLVGKKAVAADARSNDTAPPKPAPMSGLDMATAAINLARLEGQIARNVEEYNKRPRKKFIGARTEEYKPAQYIEDWRQKIERIGNLNYPEAAKGKLYGSLVVYVEIKSDGELVKAEIERSSGHRVLDEAAIRIVRLAAPYAAFTPDMRQQFDILAFARTWTFTTSDRVQSE